MSDFIVVSNQVFNETDFSYLNILKKGEWYTVLGKNIQIKQVNQRLFLIEGYILPRNSTSYSFKTDQIDFIIDLYSQYGDKFCNYIKGIFTVAIIDDETIELYNDHLGLSSFFFWREKQKFCISNNYTYVALISNKTVLNHKLLAVKALINREFKDETIISDIKCSEPATRLKISNSEIILSKYWSPDNLINSKIDIVDIDYFTNLFCTNIYNHQKYLNPNKSSITLTGGKDSRTALAVLLNQGIKPFGFTYGNPETIDCVYATLLAKKTDIDYLIINPPKTYEWFESEVAEIIKLNNPIINIHRAHRHYAIRQVFDMLGDNTSLYTGYMGGEFLMGVYFDNLIFSNFIRNFWTQGSKFLDNIPNSLQNNFIRVENLSLEDIKNELYKLNTFSLQLSVKQRQFYSLFEIGVLHHSQDIKIAQKYIKYPMPFFLDIEFVESLFKSRYSLFYQDTETKNLLKRHSLFEFNLKIQHQLFPELDSVFFAKKGTYNTSEFLRGPIYWSLIKSIRYLFENRTKYPPTFAYNANYINLLLFYLKEISLDKNSPINDIYDVSRAINSLEKESHITTESPLHKYSNIVMHYMQYNKYTK